MNILYIGSNLETIDQTLETAITIKITKKPIKSDLAPNIKIALTYLNNKTNYDLVIIEKYLKNQDLVETIINSTNNNSKLEIFSVKSSNTTIVLEKLYQNGKNYTKKANHFV